MAFDLRAIRRDIGVVAGEAGFTAWDYEPDDPQLYPAAVVGGIVELERLNRAVTRAQIAVTFYASLADPADAAARLDLALSVGVQGSFIDVVDSVTLDDGPSWKTIKLVSAGPYTRYQMPGGASTLGVTATLEITT